MAGDNISRASDRDDYCTPDDLYVLVNGVYRFTLDAAAAPGNAKCASYFCQEYRSALDRSWAGQGAVWCNPPFTMKDEFLKQALAARNENQVTVFLLPNNARETCWWREFVWQHADQVISLAPRVNYFLDGKLVSGVKFPSCLVVYFPRLLGVEYGPPRETIWVWSDGKKKRAVRNSSRRAGAGAEDSGRVVSGACAA